VEGVAVEFRAIEAVSGCWVPVFEGDNPEAWLRSAFLRDTEGHADALLALIARAREAAPGGEPIPDWGGNEMWVTFYPDRAVITHQWIFRSEGVEEEIAIPLDEADSLLRAWQQESQALRRCRNGPAKEDKRDILNT
jgi:hypothetical protein